MAYPLSSSAAPDFDNPLHPANIQNPFPMYSWLREHSPVHWSEPMRGWLITRYADVRAAFGDTVRFSSRGGVPLLARAESLSTTARSDFEIGYRFFYQQIQAFDAPIHTLHRSLITRAFSARVVEGVRNRIQRRIDGLIDAIEQQETYDFIRDFAYPLPSLVIFDLLGVPEEHYGILRRSADAFARFVPSALANEVDALHFIAETLQQTEVLLRQLLAQRRREPQPDLLSALASVREGDAHLAEEDIVVLCNFLLFAGHETTANLLAGSVLHLLADRTAWKRLRDSPSLLPNAIDELLRFVSPVLSVSRIATEDLEVGGTSIRKGQRAILMIGAANHDPAQFDEPETLRLTRARTQSLAFGHGVHLCIGALLARIETEHALTTLTARLPDTQLLPARAEYQPPFFLRALKTLPIRMAQREYR